jgi:hypothetical protein
VGATLWERRPAANLPDHFGPGGGPPTTESLAAPGPVGAAPWERPRGSGAPAANPSPQPLRPEGRPPTTEFPAPVFGPRAGLPQPNPLQPPAPWERPRGSGAPAANPPPQPLRPEGRPPTTEFPAPAFGPGRASHNTTPTTQPEPMRERPRGSGAPAANLPAPTSARGRASHRRAHRPSAGSFPLGRFPPDWAVTSLQFSCNARPPDSRLPQGRASPAVSSFRLLA